MNKKFEIFKTCQLVLFLAVAGLGLYQIFSDGELYALIGHNTSVKLMCALFWVALVAAFICIYWDFATHSAIKKSLSNLDYAVYNDTIAGIANRYSCDAVIEKYIDKKLPDTLGCMMLDISNLKQINDAYGHRAGNELIQEFGNIIYAASVDNCFVGRNGGNKFMALFENCTLEKMDLFESEVEKRVSRHNQSQENARIEFSVGRALSAVDKAESITALISLADRRMLAKTDNVTGLKSRTGLEELINSYNGVKLNDDFGCVVIELLNLGEINDCLGFAEGDGALKRLGDIVRGADENCIAGRSGGISFMALFKAGGTEAIEAFTKNVERLLQAEDGRATLKVGIGTALASECSGDMKALTALALNRINREEALCKDLT